jgi:hypothetical protein
MQNQIINNKHRLDVTMTGLIEFNNVELRLEKQSSPGIKMKTSHPGKQ